MRVFLRALAWLLLLVTALAVVADVTYSLAQGRLVLTTLMEQWARFSPRSLVGFQGALKHVPFLWSYLVKPVLSVPAWVVLGALALLCARGGRRRSKVEIFAN